MMLSIWKYVETETAKKSGAWHEPGVVGNPHLQSRCIYCQSTRMGVATRWVEHFMGTTGTSTCGGPQQREHENSASFNKRLAEFKDLKLKLTEQSKKKRIAKKADEELLGGSKKVRNDKIQNQTSIGQFGFNATSTNTYKDNEITQLLARGLISAGIAPNVLDNKHFQDALLFIKKASPNWLPPSPDTFYKRLLEEESRKVREKMSQERVANAKSKTANHIYIL